MPVKLSEFFLKLIDICRFKYSASLYELKAIERKDK